MCGIAGFVNRDGEAADRGVLARMTGTLAHRGPDGEGESCHGPAGLGHRRLSIIDVDGGAQPMSNEDGSVWVTFNGEIYNDPALRSWLQSRGHVFRTGCDTESLVHLYEEHGPDFARHLNGMFALAIWDIRTFAPGPGPRPDGPEASFPCRDAGRHVRLRIRAQGSACPSGYAPAARPVGALTLLLLRIHSRRRTRSGRG